MLHTALLLDNDHVQSDEQYFFLLFIFLIVDIQPVYRIGLPITWNQTKLEFFLNNEI